MYVATFLLTLNPLRTLAPTSTLPRPSPPVTDESGQMFPKLFWFLGFCQKPYQHKFYYFLVYFHFFFYCKLAFIIFIIILVCGFVYHETILKIDIEVNSMVRNK